MWSFCLDLHHSKNNRNMHLKIPSLAVFQVYFLVISRVVSFDDSLFFNSRYWKAYFDRLLTPCMNVSEMLILYKNPQIELDKNKFLLSMEVEFLQTMNFLIPVCLFILFYFHFILLYSISHRVKILDINLY